MSRLENFQTATDAGGDDRPLEHYGVEVVPPWQERDLRKFHGYTPTKRTRAQRVPVDRIKGGQSTVEPARVQQHLENKHLTQVNATGKELPDGSVMLEDGHHRLAAAKLRGDKTMHVLIQGRYGERYPGTEGRW